jgi:hypothetical protein
MYYGKCPALGGLSFEMNSTEIMKLWRMQKLA